ncbi:MFS transporter [Methanofollis sp. UBA420]|jgi:MFS family permease|uniref:MFS transporter n=1 Tax=Methanofollis sp. UBA420 TaxID=1915514 RepID=UPI00316AE725
MPDLSPTENMSMDERRRGLRLVLQEGMVTQAMVTLTGGVFLVAFALQLGASNTIIGLLAAIPPLAELFQMPSVYLVTRIKNRRRLTVTASFLARSFWVVIAAIPFVVPPSTAVWALVGAMCCYSILSGISHCAWNSWIHDLLPQTEIGDFFSRRMRLSTILAIILSLAAAFFIDFWKTETGGELTAYSVLFFGGYIAGMVGVYLLSRTPEPLIQEEEAPKLRTILKEPASDRNFRNLLTFLGSWNFAINLAAPFFTVYMLQRLGMDIGWVIALAVLSQIASVASFKVWGHTADRLSHKSVLQISGPIFMIAILAWTFTTLPEPYFLTIPLLIVIHILTGISTAGVTLSTNYIGLKLAPQGHATSYIAAASITNYLAAGVAPIVGGLFADFFAAREASLTLTWTDPAGTIVLNTLDFQHWDFFFFFAFIIGLYSLHRLSAVHEEGEVKERIVIHELLAEVRREMRNLSTAGGLRTMIRPPVARILKSQEKKLEEATYDRENRVKGIPEE